ncbi:MAG: histidine-type phosphatase [Bacteroidales bacterium]|nr:histidine-type phosphatase [Bacteroidales bacterium]
MSLLTIILQIALGVFAEHPNLAASNLCGYFPQDTTISEAPPGYKPFYISHIARHGSRFLSSRTGSCFQMADTLAYYAEKDMLTDSGIALMEEIRLLHRMSEGKFGALTELGAQEHRDICARMVRHYPEVFADSVRRKVVTWTTFSQRVQDSRTAFTGELLKRRPGLLIDEQSAKQKEKSYGLQEVTGYYMTPAEKDQARKTEKSMDQTLSQLRKGYDFKAFAAKIFRNPAEIRNKTVRVLARETFSALKTVCVTYPDSLPGMGEYFTPGELYYLWLGCSVPWVRYMNAEGYTNAFTRARGGGILACIVQDADEALSATSPVAATLRFSHDTYMMPVMAAIPLEGTVLTCSEMEIPDFFQDYNYMCPACNVQMIFYRSANSPVLVKFLCNEKETLVHGLNPVTGCYYDWEKVKKSWRKYL